MASKHIMISESKGLCGRQVVNGNGADCKNCARVAEAEAKWSGKPSGDAGGVAQIIRAASDARIAEVKATETINPIEPDPAWMIELDASDIAEANAQAWAEAGSPRDEQGQPVVPFVVTKSKIPAKRIDSLLHSGVTTDPAQARYEAMEAVMAQVREHKRIFVAEAANFGESAVFAELIEEGRLTLITDGDMSRYIRTMHTADGVRITQGLPVWDYNVQVGTVDLTYWSTDGWFHVLSPTGERQSLMNAERICTRHPFTRALASDVLATQVRVSEVQAGTDAAQATDARQARIDVEAREAFEASKVAEVTWADVESAHKGHTVDYGLGYTFCHTCGCHLGTKDAPLAESIDIASIMGAPADFAARLDDELCSDGTLASICRCTVQPVQVPQVGTLKRPVATKLGRRKRKATKVNARKVKGGF